MTSPSLTILVTDHCDERWLIEIEIIAARRPAAEGQVG